MKRKSQLDKIKEKMDKLKKGFKKLKKPTWEDVYGGDPFERMEAIHKRKWGKKK